LRTSYYPSANQAQHQNTHTKHKVHDSDFYILICIWFVSK